MEYKRFLDEVEKFDFIANRETADAAVKAVLGIFASRLDEPEARKLAANLPEPLSLQRLRGQQARKQDISAGEYITEVARQVNLNEDQAETLVKTVLHLMKDTIGDDVVLELEEMLPSDWVATIENA